MYESLSTNLIAPEKSFVSEAEEYLVQLVSENPNNFDLVYEKFMDEYGWFQNSYLWVNNITKDWLKSYYEVLIKKEQAFLKSIQTKQVPEKYKLLIETASNAICYQDNKKKLGLISYIIMENWLRNLSSQIDVDYDDLLRLTVNEILSYDLKSKNEIQKLKTRIEKYKKSGKRFGVMTDKWYLNVSEEFWNRVDELNTKVADWNSLKGTIGNKWNYRWKIKIVLNILRDGKDFHKGDILVTGMTRPEFVPLMRKAWAIITDEWGITCHAAIVSRELKKPCLIWTKNATQVLKDGDLVEVDADNGIVKILSSEDEKISLSSEKEKIIEEFIQRRERYDIHPEYVFHFTYPGKVFYIHFPYYFDEDFEKERWRPINVVFAHITNWKAHLLMSIYDWFVSEIIKKFEEKGIDWAKNEVKRIELWVKKIEDDKILENQNIEYYLDKIRRSLQTLEIFVLLIK